MNADAPQRSTAAEGPSQTLPAVQASGAEYSDHFLGKLNFMGEAATVPGEQASPWPRAEELAGMAGRIHSRMPGYASMDVDMYHDMADSSTQ